MVFSAFNVTPHMQGPVHEKTFDVPHGICYNNQAHPAGLLRPAGNIWSITQEVEEVALEKLRRAGRFVRQGWPDSGPCGVLHPTQNTGILHRNLAFFQSACRRVRDNRISSGIEAVITGLTRKSEFIEETSFLRSTKERCVLGALKAPSKIVLSRVLPFFRIASGTSWKR